MIIPSIKNRVIRQYLAALSCSLSVAVNGEAMGWSSSVIPKLKKVTLSGTKITDSEISWMVAMLHVGALISPLPVAIYGNKCGRKTMLLYLTLIAVTSWLFLLFATDPIHLYIGRFLLGFYSSPVYCAAPLYIAEISEPDIRGALANIISIMLYVGALIEFLVGNNASYTTLTIVSITVPIIFFITFVFMPESPYYYLTKKNRTLAEKSLTWFRCDKSNEDIQRELEVIQQATDKQMESGKGFRELISTKGNIKGLITAVSLIAFQKFSGNGAMVAYISVTIPKNPFPGLSVNACSSILGVTWVVTAVLSSFLIDKLGKKFLLILSGTGCAISTATASAWFFLDEKTEVDVKFVSWIPFVSFMFHALFFSIGLGPIANGIIGEMFPANVKTKGSAVTIMVQSIVLFIVYKSYLSISKEFGMYMNYLIYSIDCSLSVIFVIFYMQETKGKTLEDIQEDLNKKKVKNIKEITRL